MQDRVCIPYSAVKTEGMGKGTGGKKGERRERKKEGEKGKTEGERGKTCLWNFFVRISSGLYLVAAIGVARILSAGALFCQKS